MDFRILGPLEVEESGRAIPLGGPKQSALLAVLLLNANRSVSLDRLVDALWGERPPQTAATTIHVYVSQLRKVLGRERLVTQKPGYALQIETQQPLGDPLEAALFGTGAQVARAGARARGGRRSFVADPADQLSAAAAAEKQKATELSAEGRDVR